jgi:hypothetical protein
MIHFMIPSGFHQDPRIRFSSSGEGEDKIGYAGRMSKGEADGKTGSTERKNLTESDGKTDYSWNRD